MVMMGVVTLEKGKLPSMPAGTDIDVFMCINHKLCCAECGENTKLKEIGNDLIVRFIASLSSTPGVESRVVGRSSHVVNILVTQMDRSVKFQLILAVAETPSHVLAGFDISACQLLYDGRSVYGTASALWTLTVGVMLFDQTKFSKTAVYRYKKYMQRYGLLLYIPGVPVDMIKTATTSLMRTPAGLTGIGSMLYAIVKGQAPSHHTDQSDYTDPDIVRSFILDRDINISIESLMGCVFRLQTNNGRFTGAFNPVQVNIFADLCKMLPTP